MEDLGADACAGGIEHFVIGNSLAGKEIVIEKRFIERYPALIQWPHIINADHRVSECNTFAEIGQRVWDYNATRGWNPEMPAQPTWEKPKWERRPAKGGAQWGGAAFDKETNTLYIRSMDVAELITIVERDPAKIKATSTIEQGGNLYKNYCAACHGANRQGNGAVFPELTNVKSRLSKEIAKTKTIIV